MTPKPQATTITTKTPDKLDLIKIKNFGASKDTNRSEKTSHMKEKIYANHISDYGLISTVHKDSYNSTSKTTQ